MAVPYAVSRGVSRSVTRSVTDRLFGGAASDAALFLSLYGPYGMVMDFTDASISINDAANTLDYNSQGTVSATTGALLGPGSKLTNSAPSLKFVEQADGYIAGQAHNYALRSDTPANWTASGTALTDTNLFTENGATSAHYVQLPVGATGITGATYVLTVEVKPEGGLQWVRIQGDGATGHLGTSSSFDLLNGVVGTRHASIAATSISTASADGYYTCTLEIVATGANVSPLISFATADGTGNSSYAGNSTRAVRLRKWHLRRTPSVSTYVATTSAIVYDLPYVYSNGVRTKMLPEPAATNNASYGSDWTNAVWMKSSTVSAAKDATGPDNVANSASTITFSGAGGIGRSITKGSASVEAMSVYARRSGALSGSVYMNVSSATSGTSLVTGTDSDFSGAGNWVNRSDAGGNAVVTGGRLEISQGLNNTQRGRAELQLTGLTIGRVYRALVDVAHNVVGTSVAVVYAYTGANLTGTQLCNFTPAGSPNQTYHFVATETTIYLVFSTSGAGSTFTFAIDDVEVFAMAETDVTSQITTDWTRLGEVQAGSVQHPAFSLRSTAADEIEVALFQSETGSAVTSPIPTYAGAVLRAADNITLASSLWPYQQNLSIHIAWDGGPDVTSGRLGSLYGAANARHWDLYRNGSVLASYSNHTNAGGGGILSVPAPADFTGVHKYAARFEDSNYKSATDGTLGTADTDIVVNVVATTLALGAYPAGSSVGNPGITRIAIVTRSWSDAELQEVTT